MRRRLVDGMGVVAAVDVVEDVLVGCAQEFENGVAGHVAVRADVGMLHNAVPDVAVDVRGKVRLSKKNRETAGDGDEEDDGKCEAIDGMRRDREGRANKRDG